MCWFVKRFPRGEVELRPHGGVHEFTEVFEVFAQTRRGAAVFCRRDSGGGVTAYFPPVASEFAQMIRAAVADKPARDGLTPLCGGRAELECWFGR